MFQKIDHVNISVNDIFESENWYEKVFGFKKVEEGINMSGRKFVIVARNDNMICMSANPGLISADADNGNKQHQIFHFGFRVNDQVKWKEIIQEHHLTLTYGEIDYPRSKSWYVLDPNGYEIEVSWLKSGNEMFAS
jgi:catechol-2,3-dioxygenase